MRLCQEVRKTSMETPEFVKVMERSMAEIQLKFREGRKSYRNVTSPFMKLKSVQHILLQSTNEMCKFPPSTSYMLACNERTADPSARCLYPLHSPADVKFLIPSGC